MTKPLVSIVLTTYNGERFVKDILRMLQAQTYEHFECLVIDDGSQDNTPSLYTDFAKQDNRFSVLDYMPQKNVGLSRQFGVNHANGKYIALLDHDDIWHPCKLEAQVRILETNSDIDILYTFHDRFIKTEDIPQVSYDASTISWAYTPDMLHKLLKGNYLACDSMMIRKSSESRIQGFWGHKDLYHCEDYYPILRYAKLGRPAMIQEVLTFCRNHTSNKSLGSRLRLSNCLEFLANRFESQNFPEIGRKLKSQAYKTRARHYLTEDPKKSLLCAWKSLRYYPRVKTLGVLVICVLWNLKSIVYKPQLLVRKG